MLRVYGPRRYVRLDSSGHGHCCFCCCTSYIRIALSWTLPRTMRILADSSRHHPSGLQRSSTFFHPGGQVEFAKHSHLFCSSASTPPSHLEAIDSHLIPTHFTHSSPCPSPGKPCFPICLALSISSHNNKFDAIPVELAMEFLITRKLSYTPVCTGSIGSPRVRSSPATWPSAWASWRVATMNE
jgi:hypothetical protein